MSDVSDVSDYDRATALARAKVAPAGLDPAMAAEQIVTFGLAAERAYILRDAWDEAGKPATARGSRGQVIAHPLVKAIESAERHLAAADAALVRRRAERTGNLTPSSLGKARAPDRRLRAAP